MSRGQKRQASESVSPDLSRNKRARSIRSTSQKPSEAPESSSSQTRGGTAPPSHSPSNSNKSQSSGNSQPSSDTDLPPVHDEVYRIQCCIDYVQSRRREGLNPRATIRFKIPRSLDFLRAAAARGEATMICREVDTETYEIGVEPPPEPFPSGISSTWWEGKTPAEIMAGPLASERDVRKAQGIHKGRETRKQTEIKKTGDPKTGRTKKEIETQKKLEEGMRRQKEGDKMNDSSPHITPSPKQPRVKVRKVRGVVEEEEEDEEEQAESSSSSSSSSDDDDDDEDEDDSDEEDESGSEDDDDYDHSIFKNIKDDDEDDETYVDKGTRGSRTTTKRATSSRPTRGVSQPAKEEIEISSDKESNSSSDIPIKKKRSVPPRRPAKAAPKKGRKRPLVESSASENEPEPPSKERKTVSARKTAASGKQAAPRSPPAGTGRVLRSRAVKKP